MRLGGHGKGSQDRTDFPSPDIAGIKEAAGMLRVWVSGPRAWLSVLGVRGSRLGDGSGSGHGSVYPARPSLSGLRCAARTVAGTARKMKKIFKTPIPEHS